MEIILLEKVQSLGQLGDIVRVKDGYARNFLIPTGRARRATEQNKADFETRRQTLQAAAEAKLQEAQKLAAKLAETTVTITQKAGVDGRLFGSVTNLDVANALKTQGYAIPKNQIRLNAGTIKTVGENTITLVLHSDVTVDLKVNVQGEAI